MLISVLSKYEEKLNQEIDEIIKEKKKNIKNKTYKKI